MATAENLSERVARIEGAYEHLATKADLERVRTEITALRGWIVGAAAVASALMTAIGIAVRLWG